MSERFTRALDNFISMAKGRSQIRGVLGRINPLDDSVTYAVESRPDFVHVRVGVVGQLTPSIALNRGRGRVALRRNLPILMHRENGILIIDGEDFASGLLEGDSDSVGSDYGETPHALTSHIDVTLASNVTGEVLAYNGTNWVNTDNIPVTVAATINASDGKSTPVDNDELGLVDSADGFSLKTLTWSNVKATLAGSFLDLTTAQTVVTGVKTFVAGIINGDSTAGSLLTMVGAASNNRLIRFLSGAVVRWEIGVESTPETGGNAGSHFVLRRYDDAGGDLGFPVSVNRTTGAVSMSGLLNADTATFSQTTTTGNALDVYRDFTSSSTDAPVANIVQDNAGDDQATLRVQQDGTGDILQLYDGVTLVLSVADGGVTKIDGNLVLSASGTQDYRFTDDTGDALVLEGLGTGKNVDIRVNAFDADGTDNVIISFWGLGKTGATGNRERLIFGYLAADLRFQFRSEAAGTGTTRPIAIFTGSNTNQLIVAANGRVGVNSATPAGQLDVIQSSTTAAIPVLKLTQADLSEEMIRFSTTVGAGNPVNTSAAGSRYGRVRVHIEGVGEKWLELYNT